MPSTQHSANLPDIPSEQEPSAAFLTQCHRNALEKLKRVFENRRHLAVIVGDSQSTLRFVIRQFLSRLDQEAPVVHFTEPCTGASDFMGRIIQAVGFDPKDMDVDDLESIFTMFLSFQKSHNRRTVICVEHIHKNEWWVLDKIRSLVEMERENDYGLLILLAGPTDMQDLLNSRPLNAINAYSATRIPLAPLSLSESREFVRHKVEATGISNISDAFEFHAVSLVHELCAGVPDAIDTLVDRCFALADEERLDLVSKEIVKTAYEQLRENAEKDDAQHETRTVNVVTSIEPRIGTLVVQLSGDDVKELALRKGHILVGRSRLCDIQLKSPVVSRHHALISHTPEGATIVDLGSTNGTMVDGCTIKEHDLVPGNTISIGDCQIEYILGEDRPPRFQRLGSSIDLELDA